MKARSIFILILIMCQRICMAQPANDSCANAIAIDSIQFKQDIQIDLSGSSQSLVSSCESVLDINLDIWYSFVMPFDGKISFKGLSTVNRVSLHNACMQAEISCLRGSGFIDSLIGGNSYLLRYSTPSQFSGVNTITIQAFAPPPNDVCADAISIPDISIEQNLQLDNRGASESLEVSCDPAGLDNFDLWYQFDMPFDGNVKVRGNSGSQKLALFDACGGTELDCITANGFYLNLDSGNTYYLRFSTTSSSAAPASLSIQAFAPPVNDSCDQALALGDISMPLVVDLDNRGASESLNASCESSRFEYIDLWYTFQMPFRGNVKITGIFGVNRVSLFDACGGNELECNSSLAFWENLDTGQVYFLRYSSLRSQALNDQFTIQAYPTASNDECSSPIFLDSLDQGRNIDLDTRTATESLDASCESASENNLDLWYEFIMPFAGNVQITGVFGVNRVALFDACGGNELECSSPGAFFENLTQGQTYLLRYAALSQQSNFDRIFVQAVPSGLNDECVDAFLIPNVESLQMISLDTRAASESLDVSCESDSAENLDLWYKFTMPFDGLLKVSGVFGVNKLAIFDSCGGNELACFGSNGVFYNLSDGQEYILRYATTRQMANTDDFSVQAFENLAHDLCENAILIEKPDSAQIIVADTREASQSVITSCEDSTFSQQDLWYRFMMPFDGKLLIREGNNAHNFSLWDSCGGNEINCFSGFGEFTGLEDSMEYWLRYASPFGNATLDSFEVEAVMSVGIGQLAERFFKLYPNPTKDRVMIDWEGKNLTEVGITVYNLTGKLLIPEQNYIQYQGPNQVMLDLKELPKGIFLVEVRVGLEKKFFKISKIR